ncbi:hypothetical protein SprV_0802619000 [Sparganum proliferum]
MDTQNHYSKRQTFTKSSPMNASSCFDISPGNRIFIAISINSYLNEEEVEEEEEEEEEKEEEEGEEEEKEAEEELLSQQFWRLSNVWGKGRSGVLIVDESM